MSNEKAAKYADSAAHKARAARTQSIVYAVNGLSEAIELIAKAIAELARGS